MLNIPDKVKALFKSDNVKKNFRVQFPNGEAEDITNDQVVYESVKLTESICSQNKFRFGMAESPVLEFEAVGIKNIKGCEIKAYIDLDYSDLMTYLPLQATTTTPDYTTFNFSTVLNRVALLSISAKNISMIRLQIKMSSYTYSKVVRPGNVDSYDFLLDKESTIVGEATCTVYAEGKVSAVLSMSVNDVYYDKQEGHWVYRLPYGNFIVNACKRTSLNYDRYKITAYGKYGRGANHPFISPLLQYKIDYIRSASSYSADDTMMLELFPETSQDLNLLGRQDEYTYSETPMIVGICGLSTNLSVYDKNGDYLGPLSAKVRYMKIADYESAKYAYYVETSGVKQDASYMDDQYTYKDGDSVLTRPGIYGTYYYHFIGNLTTGGSVETIKLTAADSCYVYPRMFTFENEADGYYDAEYMPGIAFDPIEWQLDCVPLDEDSAVNTAIYVVESYGYGKQGNYVEIASLYDSVDFYKIDIPDSYYKVWIGHALTETKHTEASGSVKTGYSSDVSQNNIQKYPDIVGAYLELQTYVCKSTRYDGTELISFVEYPGLYPSLYLYPSATLFPEKYGERVNVSEYKSIEWEDLKPKKIGKVVFNLAGNPSKNYDAVVVDDYNEEDYYTYDMTDNYILANNNLSSAVITTESIENRMLPNFISHIGGVGFQGCTLVMKGLPYLEVGDRLSVYTKDGNEVQIIVMRRTISGIHNLIDTIECK